MIDKLMISGIHCPGKQVSSCRMKLFPLGVHPLRLFMVLSFSAVMLFPLFLAAQTRADSVLQVPINSYIVKERGGSTFLMAKDIDRTVSPASLTKILTCIMAIESGRLDDDVLITRESTMVEPSKAGFIPGEKIRLIDLVKAAMVNSSNDAAFAIAIHLSGTVDAFVAAMNYRAQRIGMKNSRFTNPAGFDKGMYAGNISTAEDLLRLTEYAVKNPVFNQVARLDQAVFVEQTTHKGYCLKTHNKLLDKYPYAIGIKTGYTTKAGRCLIARAVKDNKDILLVMLNAKTDRWNIAVDMFDSAFSANRPTQNWFTQTSRVDDARFRIPVIASPVKAENKEPRLSRSRELSKKHEMVMLKSSRKSKHQTIAELRANRKTETHKMVRQRNNRKSYHQAVAELRVNRKSEAHAIVSLRSGHNLKKREFVSSKPVRKNKKKATLS
jgi:D-alanyl-D-alanine carboxypeptidase (penicillin-binding protein 5/6)